MEDCKMIDMNRHPSNFGENVCKNLLLASLESVEKEMNDADTKQERYEYIRQLATDIRTVLELN